METFYLAIIVFIFIIAIFDLAVGVSNDAVNFLNSAIGSKAASFRTVMIIAGIGIFIGGIFLKRHDGYSQTRNLSTAIFLFRRNNVHTAGRDAYRRGIACIFNSMGMPTSTTVSMVFELLGGTFAMAMVKTIKSNGNLVLGDLINTDKALSVILAIFVSVAIAFSSELSYNIYPGLFLNSTIKNSSNISGPCSEDLPLPRSFISFFLRD